MGERAGGRAGRDIQGGRGRRPRTCHSSRAKGGSPSQTGSRQVSPCFQGTQSTPPPPARTAQLQAGTRPQRRRRAAPQCRQGMAERRGRHGRIYLQGMAQQRSLGARRSLPVPAESSTQARRAQPMKGLAAISGAALWRSSVVLTPKLSSPIQIALNWSPEKQFSAPNPPSPSLLLPSHSRHNPPPCSAS
jgi:hypothetical protein